MFLKLYAPPNGWFYRNAAIFANHATSLQASGGHGFDFGYLHLPFLSAFILVLGSQ